MSEKPNEPKYPEKWSPFEDFFKSMNHFMQEPPVKGFLQHIDEFFKQPFPHSTFNMDVKDAGEKQIVTAKLPGIKKDQIGIDILGNNLTITVNHQNVLTEEDDKNKVYRRSESFQYSSRTISFPHPIDTRRVKASYQNGLLEISIPKLRGKQIDILD